MTDYRLRIVGLAVISALTLVDVSAAKDITTTTCGRHQCRTVTNGISGIATLPGHISIPRVGRFYTVSVRLEDVRWKVVYEERRQIVRAVDAGARSFLGPGWLRLTAEMRSRYAGAVRGLAPMRSAPPYVG